MSRPITTTRKELWKGLIEDTPDLWFPVPTKYGEGRKYYRTMNDLAEAFHILMNRLEADAPHEVHVTLPDNVTLGDIASAKGAIIEASTGYVDWEKLYTGHSEEHAIGAPGRILQNAKTSHAVGPLY